MARPWALALAFVASLVSVLGASSTQPAAKPIVSAFKARIVATPTSYSAHRRLEAANLRFNKAGWLEATTEFAAGQMRYTVTGRGGSELIQKRVLLPALDAERDLVGAERDLVALSDANYRFEEAAPNDDGLPRIRLIPRRKDKRLLDGFLTLTPDADLVEATGKLAKSPSFWTKEVTITRRYRSFGDLRIPVSVSSVADIRLAGRSTFSMTYDFDVINGVAVVR